MQGAVAVEKLTWGDYATVCARQSLLGAGQTELPNDFLELTDGILTGRWSNGELQAGIVLADELFGRCPCEDGTHLFTVKELTLKESEIAAQMDLTHAEKIERIKPLRDKRRADADARENRYRPSKWEREYLENRMRREAEQEERIASAGTETMLISDEDRSWAQSFGLSLA
jgi:hypothetical protein